MKSKVKDILFISITIIIVSLLITSNLISAKNYGTNQKKLSVKYIITFSEEEFIFNKRRDYDIIKFDDNGQVCEIGKPMLPIKNLLIALPKGMKATNVNIINVKEKEITGKYSIFPSQEPQKLDTFSKKLSLKKDSTIYKSNKLFPSKWLELSHQTDLAGQSIAVIKVFPIRYNPGFKTLKLLASVEFEIEGIKGYICNDYLPNVISSSGKEIYQDLIEDMVVNPDDVKLQTKIYKHQKTNIDSGDYDYVIITSKNWVNSFQPLANWKTKKGIPATIVTTDWIYNNGNYSGSNKEKIRDFIIDAHTNWGSIFFLLGGDTSYIPYHVASYKGDNIPTDTYYSDYDDDWTCEVYVGRASIYQNGSSAGGIDNFINKTLAYEKDPPDSNFAKNISLFGFDLDSYTDGEDCKIDIDDLYIPSNWSVNKVYDSYSGNHEDAVDRAVNDGQNLINHIDHSNEYYMGTGYTNHRWGLNNSEVDAFSNGDKQSIWYSIGCWAGAYDYTNCIAEHFVRDTDGGGVAFVGNTRYGWYYVGYDDFASLRYDRYFFRSFFDKNHYKLGILFSDHKMDAYNSMSYDDLNKYIFTEINLLGDPEMPLWKENPKSFVVSHPSNITIATTSLTIHVETKEGNNILNSYVCLWKGDEVYLRGYTDNKGNITFYPSINTTGKMYVTITKQNFIPYEWEIEVLLDNYPPYKPSNPNPSNGSTGVSIYTDLSWNGGDPDGDPVTYDVYFGESNTPPKISNNQSRTYYDPGTLKYNTIYYWRIIAWDNRSAFNDSPLWNFTTKKETNQPPYKPSNPNPAHGSTNVSIYTDLYWTGGDPDGDIVKYDIYLGKNIPPQKVANNQTNTTYNTETLDYNTTYFWKIISWDTQGESNESPIWMFSTEKYSNSPPNKPTISGPSSGKTGVSYEYTFVSFDMDDDDIDFYISWGDGQKEWSGPYSSTEEAIVNHTWTSSGTFTIRAKAMDTFGGESDWGTLEVTMPKNKFLFINLKIIDWLFEKFPNSFPIFRQLILS